MRPLRGLLLLQYIIENVNWKKSWEEHNIDDQAVALKDINKLCGTMVKKEADECKAKYKNCPKTVLTLQQQQ